MIAMPDEHLSMLEDNYDPEEGQDEGLCRIARSCCRRAWTSGHWDGAALRGNHGPDGAEESGIAVSSKPALELDRISRRVRLPEIPEPVRDTFCDCNPPVPILLAIYQQGDAIEACFDEESQSMLERRPNRGH